MKNTNPYTNTRIEFHILQSFPVSCLNRDDVGAPKSAVVGGVKRARVSSQCWKRQVRLAMQNFGVTLAMRSKKTESLFEAACLKAGANEEAALACANKISTILAADTLLFVSQTEADAFGEYAREKEFDDSKLKDKELAKVAKKALNPAVDALDIALFGRMVAKAPDMNVEAASSFSHAISTHKVSNEVEFFTALDDIGDEPCSAHMGTLEFNSATYYRYISLDLGQLAQSLDAEALKAAIAAFTKALFVAVPNARQTTQSGASPWEFARVMVRNGQRLQVPFEAAVKCEQDERGEKGGFLQPSIHALTEYLDKKEKLFGSLFGKVASYDWGKEEAYSIDDLVGCLQSHVE